MSAIDYLELDCHEKETRGMCHPEVLWFGNRLLLATNQRYLRQTEM